MLNSTLGFLAEELNSYLRAKTGSAGDKVKLSAIVDETGKYLIDEDSIGISVINIEEERVVKDQIKEYALRSGQHIISPPTLKLNVFAMFAANFKKYDQSLKFLTHILTFFQARPVFVPEKYAGLDQGIERLVIELQRLNYDQLNQIWAFIGGKQLPSVVYRIGMVVLQDEAEAMVQPPLTQLDTTIRSL